MLADRLPIRRIALAGTLVVGLCVLLASAAGQLWQFYVLFFLAGALKPPRPCPSQAKARMAPIMTARSLTPAKRRARRKLAAGGRGGYVKYALDGRILRRSKEALRQMPSP
ncbi:hypothetical protein [Falsiroseomonas sp. HW251]|uniref:hypothetical protein n=1 Tax=Falsiroseomonas sp. HW251 TaxID=3390998 RepID=UPI003D31FE91